MKTENILKGIAFKAGDGLAPEMQYLTMSSGAAGPDCMFVKTKSPFFQPGAVSAAIGNGCRAVLLEENDSEVPLVSRLGAVAVTVENVNKAYALACANYFQHSDRELVLVGVTGTQGKTTTCHLIEAALREAGLKCGLISSLVRRTPVREVHSVNTTPEPFELHTLLKCMRDDGATHAVVEVSSIGIAEERLHGLRFQGLAFTSIGREHFEYHGGFKEYVATKRRLFVDREMHASDATVCVLNVDDPVGLQLSREAAGSVITYGLRQGTVRPDSYSFDLRETVARLDGYEIRSQLIGEHNLYNLIAALAIAKFAAGVSTETATRALSGVQSLPGRLERVPTETALDVYIDYAHTPESVDAVLAMVTLLSGTRRRVAVVGCSGNSDRAKRPLIAKAALAGSDFCVLTSDGDRHGPQTTRKFLW